MKQMVAILCRMLDAVDGGQLNCRFALEAADPVWHLNEKSVACLVSSLLFCHDCCHAAILLLSCDPLHQSHPNGYVGDILRLI